MDKRTHTPGHATHRGGLRLLPTLTSLAPVADEVLYEGSGVPTPYWGITLDTYVPRTLRQRLALAGVTRWAEAPLGEEGLLLLGPPSSGTSHLLAAAVRRRLEAGERSIRWFNVPTLLRDFRTRGAERALDILGDAWGKTHLVVVEDFGAEPATNWATELLGMMVEHRFHRDLPTLGLSSRQPADLLGSGYGPMVRQLTWNSEEYWLDDVDAVRELTADTISPFLAELGAFPPADWPLGSAGD